MTKSENTTEEYLEAIYKFSDGGNKTAVSDMANELKISPQSVREKLKGLEKDGYINYSTDKGILLTDKGTIRAKNVIRKHRLAERFLRDSLGLEWDEVHEEACLFEHIMSEKVADALEKFLNYPENCPHGHPIPDKQGIISNIKYTKMSELSAGEIAKVEKIDETSKALLKSLLALGILPGKKIELQQIAPFGSAFMICLDGVCSYSIGRDVAEKIWVSRERNEAV